MMQRRRHSLPTGRPDHTLVVPLHNGTMPHRLAHLKAAFTARLERVRGTMSDAEFTALVDDITRMAARLEEIDARALGTTTATSPTSKEPETLA